MTDPIETTLEAAPEVHAYIMNRGTAVAVAAFTVYGAYAACRDGSAKVQDFLNNRKAKKAVEKAEQPASQK